MFSKEQGLNCPKEQPCYKGKKVPSPQRHDYSLGKKGLSCSSRQFKFFLLGT